MEPGRTIDLLAQLQGPSCHIMFTVNAWKVQHIVVMLLINIFMLYASNITNSHVI